MVTTTKEVRSAAELERQRTQREAREARQQAVREAEQRTAEIERQAAEAGASVEEQASEAREEAEQEAAARKAEIRKARGRAEREAQAQKARARERRRKEQRKIVLPYTKPQDLGVAGYISNVEAARVQAHRAGKDATATVVRLRDDYFQEVDQAKAAALADINKQKAGIVRNIRQQLAGYSADLSKQIAKLNSGISEWEAEATEAIEKAQAEYNAAIQAQLNKPGRDVFADMKDQGLIPANAVYDSYDKQTGQLNYTVPDPRTGEAIFADEQAAGNIPENATYKSYDRATGQLSYEVPKKTGPYLNTAQNTTAPGPGTTNVLDAAGGMAMAGSAVMTIGTGVAAVPSPPTWVIGGALIATALIIGIINRERIASGVKDLVGKNDQASQASDAVITDSAGSIAYTTAQIRIIPREKGAGAMTFPLRPLAKDVPERREVKAPTLPGFQLTQGSLEIPGTPVKPRTIDTIIIRDAFDVPELRQKGANVMYAAAALQAAGSRVGNIAVKELGVSRTEYNRLWDQVNEHLRQGRAAAGRRIIEDMARSRTRNVAIHRHMRLAYEAYLRKKAILDAARKAYIKSLNPQPIKGRESNKAMAAALGVWLAQDIIHSAVVSALNKGDDMKSALADAQSRVQAVAKDLGLTQQHINAANATVVYNLAVSSMAQEAIKTADLARNQGWTDTQLQTRTFTATQNAVKAVTNSAVQSKTLSKTQAKSMTRELTRAAEQTASLTSRFKLPRLKRKKADQERKGEYPDGTVVFRMGSLKGKGGQFKVIKPDALDVITLSKPPKGMRRTTGTPQQTLTFLGGKVPYKNVAFDLGVTDGFIDVKNRTIRFSGDGEKTDVGTRLPSTTKGVSLTDKAPLLQELTQKPRVSSRMSTKRVPTKSVNLDLGDMQGVRRGRMAPGAVYSDKKGTRLSRKKHRGWKRIG
jgi:hypothetical protein